jgi:hypothetical protein
VLKHLLAGESILRLTSDRSSQLVNIRCTISDFQSNLERATALK